MGPRTVHDQQSRAISKPVCQNCHRTNFNEFSAKMGERQNFAVSSRATLFRRCGENKGLTPPKVPARVAVFGSSNSRTSTNAMTNAQKSRGVRELVNTSRLITVT